MKRTPILFKGEMVRAIIEGRKTQTRRIVKLPLIDRNGTGCEIAGCEINSMLRQRRHDICPMGKAGDRLWVKEIWKTASCYDEMSPLDIPEYNTESIRYLADEDPDLSGRVRAAIHMPRKFSRMDLEIVSVRVERLQDISEEDAVAEGVNLQEELYPNIDTSAKSLRRFPRLWDSINGKTHPWSSNPWVWIYEFKKV